LYDKIFGAPTEAPETEKNKIAATAEQPTKPIEASKSEEKKSSVPEPAA
jgi:hypothetical protein